MLCIHPTSRGYAFVLFDSALSPHDWGTKDVKQDVASARTITSARELLLRYRPDVLVIEDVNERGTRRTIRLKRIFNALSRVATDIQTDVVVVPRKKVRSTFAMVGALNKHEIAKVIASQIEAFAPHLPRARKAWQAEDRRMGLFDAASRALTYYYSIEQEAT